MNNISVSGRLARDPECKEFNDGKTVCDFSIAVNGYKKEDTVWIKVKAWGNRAKSCSKFCKKGSLVNVSGSIRSNAWTAKDGSSRKELYILASDVEFVHLGNEDEKATQPQTKEESSSVPPTPVSAENQALEDQLEVVPF